MIINFYEIQSCKTILECEMFPISCGDFVQINEVNYRVKTKYYIPQKGILNVGVTKIGDVSKKSDSLNLNDVLPRLRI